MADKEKYSLEFLIKSSPTILYNHIGTPSGLGEWFCDDANIVKGDIYRFEWDGAAEEARKLGLRKGEYIRWQWLEDEEEGLDTYVELRIHIDAITKEVALLVTDFAEPDEMDESMALWEQQVVALKQQIGS